MYPIKITDTTFRDAHQSLIATRMGVSDMEPIASEMDSLGFASMEVWGGATFDVSTRFLSEDPWERLRTLKRLMPSTPFMMLLRGQSLVGYRHYANDIVESFIQQAANDGIDIFRVFDALNEEQNMRASAKAIKSANKHLQLAICYSTTEKGKLGGKVYNLEYYIDKAKLFQEMGADSICIKDMSGILSPYDSYELFSNLKQFIKVPLQLHTHYTSGMASMTTLKAIEAGVDAVDTCLSPLALRTSQPALEPLLTTLSGTDKDPAINLSKISKITEYLEEILPKYRKLLDTSRFGVIDANVLTHQIPGGMISNLILQLKESKSEDRLQEVFKEVAQTRKDLGYPPLVTPISQIVGSQAVTNVLFGRYKMISEQTRDYILGKYGTPPSAIDPMVNELISKTSTPEELGYSSTQLDDLTPELPAARKKIQNISTNIDDVLTYSIFPSTGLRFLKTKYGIEPPNNEVAPQKNQSIDSGSGTKVTKAHNQVTNPRKHPKTRSFNVSLDGVVYEVEVEPAQPTRSSPTVLKKQSDMPEIPSVPTEDRTPDELANPTSRESQIVAPMPGIVSKYLVDVGDAIKAGDPILILQAMKMENALPSTSTGTVKTLNLPVGSKTLKGDLLAVIEQ